MLNVNHFLNMFFKNFLQNIYKIIMRENKAKRNSEFLMNEEESWESVYILFLQQK